MASETKNDASGPPAQPNRTPLEAGPFVLRTLLDDVPLSADGGDEDIKINCVDYLDGNLYVGTSASELLHFVQIPADPADETGTPVFIIASRLRPAFAESHAAPASSRPGIQQILLLPQVGKACVLCNWTVTFYSLPELSPVLTQVKNCNWIGGLDLNEPAGDTNGGTPRVTILLSLIKKIQVVRIGQDARVIKNIDFAGSTISVRRDTFACVADSRSYALLDVDRQLKIPLMSISSLDDSQPGGVVGQVQSIQSTSDGGLLRSSSTAAQARPAHLSAAANSHSRSTSLGGFITGSMRGRDKSPVKRDELGAEESETPPPPPSKSPLPKGETSTAPIQPDSTKPLPAPAQPSVTAPALVFLKPHIVSPTSDEFLLVTGTGPLEPGIGMFVNVDGDPTRPTLEFERYPKEIIIDGGSSDLTSSRPSLGDAEEGYVIASMTRDFEDGVHHGLEIQRWDVNPGENEEAKFWLEAKRDPSDEASHTLSIGIRSLLGANEAKFNEVSRRLCQSKFSPFSLSGATPEASTALSLRHADSRTALSMERMSKERDLFERELDSSDEEALPDGWEATRNAEEAEFAARLAKTSARLAVWTGRTVWWAMRNPLILQLEAALDANALDEKTSPQTTEERRQLFAVLNSFRGRDAKSELEFMTFSYIRQRAGALLFMSFMQSEKAPFAEPELKALEEVLLDGGLDPRVVLAMIPGLRNEINQSRRGIWVFGGVKGTVQRYMMSKESSEVGQTLNLLEPKTLQFLKRFLTACRRKKGFGSVADESHVSRTVDAALLAVLLELDQRSPKGLARSGSVRAELNELVDKGVDCFDRAVDLLESYQRLYVLSRLYQSRKMAADVLATWRRIIEGEPDAGGELQDGELRVREYLSKISNQALVQEYGLWLADRNPKLGVQVFAEDKGRAPKFDPANVVALLRDEAPAAVKYYLEHLVFGKGHTVYVRELINYYLDIVVADLQASAAARAAMAATYEAYRALRPPKPTYRRFLTDNAPADDDVWHSRLRLLQLLGGAHEYDAPAIRARIAQALPATADGEGGAEGRPPPSQGTELLVPETILLDGRERRHEDALRLLVHGLGDYDTAVSYCLRGGASLYTPAGSGGGGGEGPARRESLPSEVVQRQLFGALLREFLRIQDVSDRVEQTGALLARFGGWFDVLEVLGLIPDAWSVDIAAGFLVSALRRLARERHESLVARALSGAENLRVGYELLTRVDEKGPQVEAQN